jgi:hypothetical protein
MPSAHHALPRDIVDEQAFGKLADSTRALVKK